MLKSDPNEGLLPSSSADNVAAVNNSAIKSKSPVKQTSQIEEEDVKPAKTVSRKKKSERSELTYILKVLNFLVGIAFVAFAAYCYSYGFDKDDFNKTAQILRYVMPAYVGLSGLIILLIECRVGFMIRSMRFLYNYFGRGLFNIYAGVMPLMMISSFDSSLSTFEIITLVAASVMCLVGVLYICLKVFCCEKEGDRIDKEERRRRKESSDSD